MYDAVATVLCASGSVIRVLHGRVGPIPVREQVHAVLDRLGETGREEEEEQEGDRRTQSRHVSTLLHDLESNERFIPAIRRVHRI